MKKTFASGVLLLGFLSGCTRSSLLIVELGDAPAEADTGVCTLIRRERARYYTALGMARRNIALTRSEAL